MALRVRVPKEIKTYKERIIGTMDLRQLICATIAFIYSAGIIYFLVWKLHWTMDSAGNVLIPLDMPVLAFGWIRPKGMSLEKYIGIILHYQQMNGLRIYENRKEVSLHVHKNRGKIKEYKEDRP